MNSALRSLNIPRGNVRGRFGGIVSKGIWRVLVSSVKKLMIGEHWRLKIKGKPGKRPLK